MRSAFVLEAVADQSVDPARRIDRVLTARPAPGLNEDEFLECRRACSKAGELTGRVAQCEVHRRVGLHPVEAFREGALVDQEVHRPEAARCVARLDDDDVVGIGRVRREDLARINRITRVKARSPGDGRDVQVLADRDRRHDPFGHVVVGAVVSLAHPEVDEEVDAGWSAKGDPHGDEIGLHTPQHRSGDHKG